MRTSVVDHPKDEPLIIIHRWQTSFCDGNEVAAALMSFFEYWHNIKIDIATQNKKANQVARQHGENGTADTALYQWHTEAELIDGIERIAKTGKTLTKGIDLLVSKGVITIHKNPNPHYKFDKTRHFLFHPDIVNEWLSSNYRSSKNTSRQSKNPPPSSKIPSAIPETTSEITKPESLKASSAKADYSRPISLLSEKEVKDLKLPLSTWKEYLTDEQAQRGRSGVLKFLERKVAIGPLLPSNEDELKFFEILAAEYEADGGKSPPSKFPSLETKRLFNEAAEFHNGTLESVIRKALHKRGKGLAKIVDYINSPEWKKGNSNDQTRRGKSGSQGISSQAQNFEPGNGRTPEMQAALERAFAPNPG